MLLLTIKNRDNKAVEVISTKHLEIDPDGCIYADDDESYKFIGYLESDWGRLILNEKEFFDCSLCIEKDDDPE